MTDFTIHYQAGKRYMVCVAGISWKKQLASEEECRAAIQAQWLEDRQMYCTWLRPGNC